MRTLVEDGIEKAAQGLTTLEEVVRVVSADETAVHKEEATKPEKAKAGEPHAPTMRGNAAMQNGKGQGQPELPPAGIQSRKASDSGGKELVLVVEDSSTIASVVKYYLELEGFEVVIVKDGDSGLEAAKRDQPRVVVTDCNMPGMDGVTMVKALRADSATRGIAVLMLTSEGGIEKETEALEAGVDDYIVKPVEPRRLAARVKSVIARSQSRNTGVAQ
jgi:PleD family two-component response regulator